MLSRLQQIEDIISREETEKNITELKLCLTSVGNEIINSMTYQFGQNVFHVNLAGLVCMQDACKPKFLNCILDIKPQLLTEEYFASETMTNASSGAVYPTEHSIVLLTPLRIAIKNRNLEMVTTILTHQVFLAHRNAQVENNCSQLVTSYMWALLWYYETRDKDKILATLLQQNLTGEVWQQKAQVMLESQDIILIQLLDSCKASMWEARIQGKNSLPEKIMNMCVTDGVFGEGYWQHPYGFDLLDVQRKKALEICGAFFTEEERNKQSEGIELESEPELESELESEQEPGAGQRSVLAYIGVPLIIGLGVIALWKFINRDFEQACVIS